MALACALNGAEGEIRLPAPDKTGGKPLMEVISARRSLRKFAGEPLTEQEMSDILFAAHGITGEGGRRTTATARNVLDMEIFVALPQGLYRYDAAEHSLKLVLDKDIRKLCGIQPFHAKAPMVLVYVSNLDCYAKAGMTEEQAAFYGPIHAGSISQNVYLAAASHGLSTVVCNAVEKKPLARAMKLGPQYVIMLTQPVARTAR